jgi:phosphatidate cytidylyltransferase
VIAVAVLAPPQIWAALIGVAVLVAAWECMSLITRAGPRVASGVGALAALAAGATFYRSVGTVAESSAFWLLAGLVGAIVLLALLRPWLQTGPRATATAALAVLATAVYCGVLPAHLALLRREAGSAWVLLALGVAWGGDVAGYLAGKAWGGPRLAPTISPGKTVVGAVVGLLAAVGVGIGFARTWPSDEGTLPILLWTAGAGVLSQLGDLAESLLKRRYGAKDSGAAIPGHGGVLDCVDGLALAAPWLYYAHRYLG